VGGDTLSDVGMTPLEYCTWVAVIVVFIGFISILVLNQ
jgi:hypothetical protein